MPRIRAGCFNENPSWMCRHPCCGLKMKIKALCAVLLITAPAGAAAAAANGGFNLGQDIFTAAKTNLEIEAVLAALTIAAANASFAEFGNGRFNLGLDMLTVANADKKWKRKAANAVSGYAAAGYTMKTSVGIGGRVGVRFPLRDNDVADVCGVSIGYVKGPAAAIKVNAESALTPGGTYNENINTSFFRILYENAKTYPVGSGSARFSIGAGVGAAYGRIESKATYRGSFIPVFGAASATNSTTWTGFTWEINPAVVIPFRTIEMELGARIAGFPKLKGSNKFSEFSWNPFGVYWTLYF